MWFLCWAFDRKWIWLGPRWGCWISFLPRCGQTTTRSPEVFWGGSSPLIPWRSHRKRGQTPGEGMTWQILGIPKKIRSPKISNSTSSQPGDSSLRVSLCRGPSKMALRFPFKPTKHLPLKNKTFLNFLGNLGYMSVKDELPQGDRSFKG